MLKLKDERIEELQKQLERKQSRRKEVEILQNSLSVPFDEPPSPNVNDLVANKILPLKSVESLPKLPKEESRIPIPIIDLTKSISKPSITEVTSKDCIENDIIERVKSNLFKEIVDKTNSEGFYDPQELDGEAEKIATIETTIQKEIKEICEYNGAPNMLI